MDKRYNIVVSVPEDIHDALFDYGKKTGIPVATLVRSWIYERLTAMEENQKGK